jgi:hypothetical protein
MPLEFEWDESQLLSAKADSLRVKGTEAQSF